MILTISLLLLTLTSLGQISYPVAQVNNGDTTIIITPAQLKFANKESAKVVYLSKKTFTLETVVTSLEKSLVLQEAINVENDNKLKNYMINIESYTIIIDEKNKTIEDNIKAAKKEKRKAILTSGIVGIIGGLVLSIFI